jgi:hypothetical protein
MDHELDLRLEEIRGRISPVDPLLASLINTTARVGLDIQLGLVFVLGGATVRGVPVKSVKTGEVLDRDARWFFQVIRAMALAAGSEESDWEEYQEISSAWNSFTELGDREVTKRAELFEAIDARGIGALADVTELPDDLAREAVAVLSPAKAVTLESAEIRIGEGTWEPIGLMRVQLAQVQAWWTFSLPVPAEAAAFLT